MKNAMKTTPATLTIGNITATIGATYTYTRKVGGYLEGFYTCRVISYNPKTNRVKIELFGSRAVSRMDSKILSVDPRNIRFS